MTTTFENAKVGDRVWSMDLGWCTIDSIDPKSTTPIHAIDDSKKNGSYYTLDGKLFLYSIYPILFWDELKFEVPTQPMPKLEVDTKVLVWLSGEQGKNKRYFSHFNKNKIVCFSEGATSWSYAETVEWDNWELAPE